METDIALNRSKLTTPRAAAIAGIIFSVLLLISLVLIRISVPSDPQEAGAWLSAQETALKKVWDNDEDEVWNDVQTL